MIRRSSQYACSQKGICMKPTHQTCVSSSHPMCQQCYGGGVWGDRGRWCISGQRGAWSPQVGRLGRTLPRVQYRIPGPEYVPVPFLSWIRGDLGTTSVYLSGRKHNTHLYFWMLLVPDWHLRACNEVISHQIWRGHAYPTPTPFPSIVIVPGA